MLPLETELSRLFPETPDREIVAAYYGIDGTGVRSYQTIGRQMGVTRSRIHQIVRDYVRKYSIKSLETPTLDTVVDVVGALMPCRAAVVESTLRKRGLTVGLFKLECIMKIAKLLGRSLPLRITHVNGTAIAHSSVLPRWRGIQQVRAYVRYWGAARIGDIGRWVSSDSSRELEMARLTIVGQKDFRWLNADSGWFWFAETGRNRVVSRIRKMISVAVEMDASILRCGLSKMALGRLPGDCLLELCRQLPGIAVSGNRIRATAPISRLSVLSKTEQIVFELISRSAGAMCLADLETRCAARGVTRPTLFQCLTDSPIVIRVSVGHYALLDPETAARGMVDCAVSDPASSRIRPASRISEQQGNSPCRV